MSRRLECKLGILRVAAVERAMKKISSYFSEPGVVCVFARVIVLPIP
jgi:hypothetical protein